MAKPKGGLGRGLSDLLQVVEIDSEKASAKEEVALSDNRAGGVIYVDVNEIKPNDNQPRKVFDEAKIEELATSISSYGLIQPIILRKAEKGYEIVAGERRWRAARKANLSKVPCILKELSDEENMVISIIENMQREDLNPIEEAEALSQMIKRFGFSQEEVAKSVGKSRSYVTNSLRLLKLPRKILDFVQNGQISSGHAKMLIGIEDGKKQMLLAEKVVKEDISVREIEKLVKELSNPKKKLDKKAKKPEILAIEDELKQILGTKVNIKQSGRKGKLEIEYYNREELERLIDILKNMR
ncbi:MAG: ParB/RepB/Spo0J family partition protein [Candidatus Fimenecus sp.]